MNRFFMPCSHYIPVKDWLLANALGYVWTAQTMEVARAFIAVAVTIENDAKAVEFKLSCGHLFLDEQEIDYIFLRKFP